MNSRRKLPPETKLFLDVGAVVTLAGFFRHLFRCVLCRIFRARGVGGLAQSVLLDSFRLRVFLAVVGSERRDFDLLLRDAFRGYRNTRLGLRALRGGRDGRRAASCVGAGHDAGDDPGSDLRTGGRNRLLRLTRGALRLRDDPRARHFDDARFGAALRLAGGALRLFDDSSAWNGRCFRNRRHGRHGSRWLALRLGRGLLRLGRRFLYFGGGLLRLGRGLRRCLRCFLQLRNGAEHRFLHLLVTRHLAGGLGTALRLGAAVLRRLGGARGALRRGRRRLDRFRRSLPHRHPAEERLVLLDALLCFRERGLRPPERLACLLRRLLRLDFDLFLVLRQGLLRLVGSLGPLAVRAVELRKGFVDVLADLRDPRHQVLERTALLARLVVRRRCLRVRCRDLIDGAARLRHQHARALVDGDAALLDGLPEGTLHLLPQLVDLRVLVLELRDELLRLLLVLALLLLVPAGEGVVLRLGGLAVLVGFAHRVVLHLVGGRDALVGAAGGGVGTPREVADQIGARLLPGGLEVFAELLQLCFHVFDGLLHGRLELLGRLRFRGAFRLLQVPGSDGGLQGLLQHLLRRLQHFLLDLLQQPVDRLGDPLLHFRSDVLELLLCFVPPLREELLGVLLGRLRILQAAALHLRERLLRVLRQLSELLLESSQRLAQRRLAVAHQALELLDQLLEAVLHLLGQHLVSGLGFLDALPGVLLCLLEERLGRLAFRLRAVPVALAGEVQRLLALRDRFLALVPCLLAGLDGVLRGFVELLQLLELLLVLVVLGLHLVVDLLRLLAGFLRLGGELADPGLHRLDELPERRLPLRKHLL